MPAICRTRSPFTGPKDVSGCPAAPEELSPTAFLVLLLLVLRSAVRARARARHTYRSPCSAQTAAIHLEIATDTLDPLGKKHADDAKAMQPLLVTLESERQVLRQQQMKAVQRIARSEKLLMHYGLLPTIRPQQELADLMITKVHPPPPPGGAIRTLTLFFFLLWHPLSDVWWRPTNRHRLPTNRHRLPTNRHRLHTNRHRLPTGRHRLHTNRHRLHTNRHRLPTNRHRLPTGPHRLHTNRHRLPTNRHRLPTGRHRLHTNRHRLHTNRHRLPTNRHRRAYWTLPVLFYYYGTPCPPLPSPRRPS